MIDTLIEEMNAGYPLHDQAGALVNELKPLLDGIRATLEQLEQAQRRTGGSQTLRVPSLAADQVETLLGQGTIEKIAERLHLAPAAAAAAAAYALPRLAQLFAPGELPAPAPSIAPENPAPITAEPVASPHPAAPAPARRLGWLLPVLLVLALAGLVWRCTSGTAPRAPAPAPAAPAAQIAPVPAPVTVAQAPAVPAPTPTPPPPAPAAPAANRPARLSVNVSNGIATFGGKVGTEEARAAVTAALATAYGTGRTQGNITLDPTVAAPAWLPSLGTILAPLRANGSRALFDGNTVQVGGAIPTTDRDRIIGTVRGVLGATGTAGPLPAGVADFAADANRVAQARLATLRQGFSAQELAAILNLTTINFANRSATVPGADRELLAQAAARLRTLPPGTRVEIAGYTDATGSPAGNERLSQRRAEAVRNVLIQDGTPAAMLTARGYGAASPVSPNSTEEGRLQNRRIEYHALPR